MNNISVKKITYKGWENCIELSNGTVSIIITTDMGPRIISYGFTGQANVLFEEEENLGTTGGSDYKTYGGHRLWHAPQVGNRPNEPANDPVEYEITDNSILLRQKIEPVSRIQKEITVSLSPEGTELTLTHRLVNKHAWPIKASAWGLTTLAPGGVEIIPWVLAKTPDYLPNTALVYWPWTKPNDPRLTFYEKYILLRQIPENAEWFKLGMPNLEGWAAYVNKSSMFVKTFDHLEGAEYPDYLCSFETFTYDRMMEIETLSPLVLLSTDSIVESEEKWYLFDNVPTPKNEEDIDRNILPLIRSVKRKNT
jgi:hypothetical protein